MFKGGQIRRYWDEEKQRWLFSVVDVIAVLTESDNPAVYWRVLKKRLKDEHSEQTVTHCNGLKMPAADGKMRVTDMAGTETMFRIIQSVPSPKAEPFKRWLAKVGYERVQEIENPELAQQRMKQLYEQKGYFNHGLRGLTRILKNHELRTKNHEPRMDTKEKRKKRKKPRITRINADFF